MFNKTQKISKYTKIENEYMNLKPIKHEIDNIYNRTFDEEKKIM